MAFHDAAELFRFGVSPLELVLRGSAIYWFLFLLFRFVMRRDTGALAISYILLLVLIADASQNAMAGAYTTIAEGVLLVSTLVGWNWLMNWASYRFNTIRRLVEAPPIVLVRRGRLIGRALRSELITVPELMASLRSNGIDKLAEVRVARMEPDGSISVIREDRSGEDEPSRRRKPLG